MSQQESTSHAAPPRYTRPSIEETLPLERHLGTPLSQSPTRWDDPANPLPFPFDKVRKSNDP